MSTVDEPPRRKFADRQEAGQVLATHLLEYADRSDVLILALPRGGVPVAYEVAKVLHAPLDVCLVRKLGVPGQKELAMGAIAADGVMILNQRILQTMNIPQAALMAVAAEERHELERRDRLYHAHSHHAHSHHAHPSSHQHLDASSVPAPPQSRPLAIRDRTIILIDDGIATSSTLRAAIVWLRRQHPQTIIAATPVAPPSVCQALEEVVDRVVCCLTPEPLQAIGLWYEDFSQTSDQEVCLLLQAAELEIEPQRHKEHKEEHEAEGEKQQEENQRECQEEYR